MSARRADGREFPFLSEALPLSSAHAAKSREASGEALMFPSIFEKKSNRLRPMRPADAPAVLRIIEAHDEDDAAEAAEHFQDSLDGLFVMSVGSSIVGVTGAHQDPDVDDVFWLSWTYLAPDAQGQGFGQQMIDALGEMLIAEGCRKVFISTSDYVDEDGDDYYAQARSFYENAMGAKLEASIPDYYELGETQLIYGATLQPNAPGAAARPRGPLMFEAVETSPETDDGADMVWREGAPGEAAAGAGLESQVAKALQVSARFAMFAAPSSLVDPLRATLNELKFEPAGRLADYERPGEDREIFRRMLR